MQNKKKMPIHSPISDLTRLHSCGVEPRENASPMWRKWPLPCSLFFPLLSLSLIPFVCHALRETVRPLMEEPSERWASETGGQRCQAPSVWRRNSCSPSRPTSANCAVLPSLLVYAACCFGAPSFEPSARRRRKEEEIAMLFSPHLSLLHVFSSVSVAWPMYTHPVRTCESVWMCT